MVFTLKKPRSAPKRRPSWPDRRPDIDKLLRSTFDALVSAGAIETTPGWWPGGEGVP
jgi:Holliday junction resolvase RusA-like endonuclease